MPTANPPCPPAGSDAGEGVPAGWPCWLPPPRWGPSPRTGWGREHWEALADRLLDGLEPYASPGGALYRLPGRASWSGPLSDGLEGFARSFLLASFRIAGAHAGAAGSLPPAVTERIDSLTQRYVRGLTVGTTPGSAESWPAITDRSQPMVEAASIAIGLHESRPWLWDRLPDGVRARIAGWLGGFTGRTPVDNNWRLFQVVVGQFLASVGAPFRQAEIDAGLERIEDWYAGGGWYRDGDGRNFDYYTGWALHFYPLLWSRIADATPGAGAAPQRVAAYRERLRDFLADHAYFFGGDGAPVHQGRSLTYRYAAVAPVWIGALSGAGGLPPGLARRLASGAARHFTERGVPDARGLLRVGWYGAYRPVAQGYSGPGSPYWAAKAFAGLLLPPGAPVWTAPELPLPVEESDTRRAVAAPGWLLHGTRADGIVRLLNHGTDHWARDTGWAHDEPHYTKLAYTSRTGPLTGAGTPQWHLDGHVALLDADGTPSRRTRLYPLGVTGEMAASWYAARLPGDPRGYRLATASLPYGPLEVRVHTLAAPRGVAPGLVWRDGGHAVAGDRVPRARTDGEWALVVRADGLTSAVAVLHGGGTPGVRRARDAAAFGRHVAVPYVSRPVPPDASPAARTWVTLVLLTGERPDAAALRRLRAAVHAEVGTDGVRIRVDGEPERRVPYPFGGTAARV